MGAIFRLDRIQQLACLIIARSAVNGLSVLYDTRTHTHTHTPEHTQQYIMYGMS
jgi:hypothetical protein